MAKIRIGANALSRLVDAAEALRGHMHDADGKRKQTFSQVSMPTHDNPYQIQTYSVDEAGPLTIDDELQNELWVSGFSPIGGMVSIGPKSLASDETSCTFGDVSRQDDIVTWHGSCSDGATQTPSTVVAALHHGSLTISVNRTGWPPLRRCR